MHSPLPATRTAGPPSTGDRERLSLLARWGEMVYARKWWVLGLSLLLFLGAVAAFLTGGQLANRDSPTFESGKAFSLIDQQLAQNGESGFKLIFTSRQLTYRDPRFRSAMDQALIKLRADSRVKSIRTPYDSGSQPRDFVSRDQHSALANVVLGIDFTHARLVYPDIRAEVQPTSLHVLAQGDVVEAYDFDYYLDRDLRNSDSASLFLALGLLLIVFGTVVAALLPLAVGLTSVVGALGGVLLLAHATDISTYATSIVSLIGLGLSIDYSLFIVNRYREELRHGASPLRALQTCMGTAGRAIIFSGITVAIGLAGLLFYNETFLFSIGIAGAVIVATSLFFSLTFLPALLAILGHGVNRWRVPILQPKPFGEGLWHRIAWMVMGRPWTILLPTVAFLVLAGSPVLQMKLAESSVAQLPPYAEARQGSDFLTANFASGSNLIDVVLDFHHGAPTAGNNVAAAYAASQTLAAMPGVGSVQSYVNLGPQYNRAAYQQLYAQPLKSLPLQVQGVLAQSVGSSIAVFSVTTPYAPHSDSATALVKRIRQQISTPSAQVLVTGETAFSMDYVAYMLRRTPFAALFIMATTFCVLLLLLRSIVLPIKAVIMNLLSMSAAFGVMVWVFQQGHLSGLLNFTASAIDPTLPVLVFCIVFGLSMDYEVFLLTRMQEAYRRTGDNRTAVAEGLERSGRLVTGAAAIMVCVFFIFAFASVVTIKATGLSMGVAVLVDATLVRALVVPAVMRLMGRANWWAPKWLQPRN